MPTQTLSFSDQIDIVRTSVHMHPKWYRRQSPDVALLGMEPAEHYLKYGAALGRDPGRHFSTSFYVDTYPDASRSGLNPLVHFETIGLPGGYVCQPGYGGERARHDVAQIRYKLLNLVMTDRALADLEALSKVHPHSEGRAAALQELALWHMRQDTEAGYDTALRHTACARRYAATAELRARLAYAELLCWHFLSDRDRALAAWGRAAEAGDVDPDVLLARANLEPDSERRLFFVNLVLQHYAIPLIAFDTGEGAAPYDRLRIARPVSPVPDGPLVSVLVAAYNAADVLPTALRSLQTQSWRNLEVLVLDDCSSDGTVDVVRNFAASDARIRLVPMAENGGAYVARNRGLDLANGKYVTLHDAGDWSHPLKIETQVRHLETTPRTIGCMSEQARSTPDLQFVRWAGRCRFLIPNVSSFMFRRQPMREHFGYWDTVRFSADNELISRMRVKFGGSAVQELATGPLSFQRETETSAISDAALGVKGFKFGVRREYFEAQRYRHAQDEDLKYDADPARRAFAVPVIMQPERSHLAKELHHRTVVLAGDFRVTDCGSEIAALRTDNSVGLVEIYNYDVPAGPGNSSQMPAAIRREIDGKDVRVLAFGEQASCDLLVVLGLDVLRDRQRYVAEIAAEKIAILVSEIPEDWGDWIGNLRFYFGTPATLYATDADVRHHLPP